MGSKFTFLVLILLVGHADCFLGIGGFFRSGRKSIESVASTIERTTADLRQTFEQKIVPEIQNTSMIIRESMGKLVFYAGKIERNVNNAINVCIAIGCVVLYGACSWAQLKSRDEPITTRFFAILMFLSLATATLMITRLASEAVLQRDLTSGETFKYCFVAPIGIVALQLAIKMITFALCQIGAVVYFVFLGPRLVIYVAVDGPLMWVWNAHRYAQQLLPRMSVGFFMTISLPLSTLFVSLLSFNILTIWSVCAPEFTFRLSLVPAYVYFLANAYYLYFYHQRPSPQELLRRIHGGPATGRTHAPPRKHEAWPPNKTTENVRFRK